MKALSETNRIVIDLSETTFLDSTALGAILAAGRRADESHGWVRPSRNPTSNSGKPPWFDF